MFIRDFKIKSNNQVKSSEKSVITLMTFLFEIVHSTTVFCHSGKVLSEIFLVSFRV